MPTRKQVRTAQANLVKIGWGYLKVDGDYGPSTRRVVQKFVGGYARGKALRQDGRLTWRVRRAIAWSASHGGRCSANFRFAEFRSKGNGDIVVERALVNALERLRAIKGKPIPVYSGYRDPYYNDVVLPSRGVNTASFSQHKYGCAADTPESARITIQEATKAGFTGIGYDSGSKFVEHADVRHAGPNNTTGARPGSPTLWAYS